MKRRSADGLRRSKSGSATRTEESRKAADEARAQYSSFESTEAYRDYQKRRQALEEKRDTEWTRERKATAEAARKLYVGRHQELIQVTVKDTPQARRLGLDVLTFPRLDGSTSMHPLSVIIASRVLGVPYEWIYPEPSGSPWRPRPNLPNDLFLFDEYEASSPENWEFALSASRVVAKPDRAGQERLAIMINSLLAVSTSTHNAYTNLIAGKCDLNLTARVPSEDEVTLAKKRGVKIEVRPIAKDAPVFIVNHRNPVKSIARQAILQIYQRKIKSWAALGGTATTIVALWREHNSGSRELFDDLVAKSVRLPEPSLKDELFSNSMSGPFNRVTQDAQSLGYSVYYYEHYMALSPYTRMRHRRGRAQCSNHHVGQIPVHGGRVCGLSRWSTGGLPGDEAGGLVAFARRPGGGSGERVCPCEMKKVR